ncbi:MAG: GTP cyclohydrolase I FolE [Flavobacteriaceae bacterium]
MLNIKNKLDKIIFNNQLSEIYYPFDTKRQKQINSVKIEIIEKRISEILDVLGLDLNDKNLSRTPKRFAKMYVEEIFKGLNDSEFPIISGLMDNFANKRFVIHKNLNIFSVCEHHLLPFYGFIHLAYIPKDKLIKVQDLQNIINFFSRRPQVQERVTKQVVDCVSKILNLEDIACTIDAKHLCIHSRGIKDFNSSTLTFEYTGKFKNSKMKSKFISEISDTNSKIDLNIN